ncbi:ESX secretion-associated protein EspG [Actinokineospora sp.]|uniref:ESX secretion-associated protein EspG n=1 Tax=Actinokineospora sp. TaxID=1872133 RepID=UPI004037B7A0
MSEMPTGLEPDAGYREAASAWLHPSEVDLLCTFAEIAPPFPLTVHPHGATAAERRALFRTARAELAAKGLADQRGPRGVAADFVHLLRDSVGALDIVVARRDHVRGALVLAQRGEALLVSQDTSGPDGHVHLLAVSVRDAIEHLLHLVPALDAALAAPFSVPRSALDRIHRDVLAATGPDGSPRRLTGDEFERLLRAHGLDDQLARRMVTHLQPVLGNGQAGVAVRRGYADEWTRSGEELRWLDTARGRFRLAGGTLTDWMSVNPMAADELRGELHALAGELWYQ